MSLLANLSSAAICVIDATKGKHNSTTLQRGERERIEQEGKWGKKKKKENENTNVEGSEAESCEVRK